MRRASFISLDGVDGSGKTSQCRLLADWLRANGHAVVMCADPGGTRVGEVLRQLLLDPSAELSLMCEALLFMASRAQLTEEVIRPALERGDVVVADRFLLANVVFQGHSGGLAPDQLWQIGRLATGGVEPDLTLVLDVPIELAAARRRDPPDRVESRSHEYHRRVRDGFLLEARRQPTRIHVVDASQSIEALHRDICHQVSMLLKQTR